MHYMISTEREGADGRWRYDASALIVEEKFRFFAPMFVLIGTLCYSEKNVLLHFNT